MEGDITMINIDTYNPDEITELIDTSVQTEVTSNQIVDGITNGDGDGDGGDGDNDDEYSINLNEYYKIIGSGFFKHLLFANQTYWEHFSDSIGYFRKSICASFYFLCHAFWPDIFEQSGSKKINEINHLIKIKYKRRISEIKREMEMVKMI